jgi:hypothetical protein
MPISTSLTINQYIFLSSKLGFNLLKRKIYSIGNTFHFLLHKMKHFIRHIRINVAMLCETIFAATHTAVFVVDLCYLNGTTFFFLFLSLSILKTLSAVCSGVCLVYSSMALTLHKSRCYTRAHSNWFILLWCPRHSLLDSLTYMFAVILSCLCARFMLAKFNK